MLRSVHSPWDAQDDLPSARSYAPAHSRFPSISEFSDSPSVYSHAYFSPDSRDIEPNTSSFRYDADSSSQRRPSISHSEYLHEHAASSLDLDDEDLAGVSLNTADTTDDTENDDEDDDSSHRISVQGPKIRFHSRAPWETGEDAIDENDSDHSAMSTAFSRKVKSKTAKADLMRHFGKGSSARPSAESTRSQAQSNGSFEIIAGNHSSSRGALYTLAQESFSTSSLTVPSQQFPPTSPRNRHNFSLPRTTNYPPTTHYDNHTSGEPHSATSSLRGMGHISQPSSSTQDTPRSHSPASEVPRDHERSATISSFHTSQSRMSHEDFVHPYANPDLVASYAPPRPAPLRSTFGHISRSDSAATVTDSLSSRSGVFSSTITPDTSASSIPSWDHISSTGMRVHGKDISPPIAVLHSNDSAQRDHSSKLPSFHPPPIIEGVPGWNGHSSPTVTLISLQEAQARERTRSATANAMVSSTSRVHETSSRIPFPEPDDSASIASTETSATGSFKRARARSISAGTRAKGVLHQVVAASLHKPERRDSEPAVVNTSGQTLKHKKSGFMRLFNGREREKGRDKERSPPPPVPSLHGVYSEYPHGSNGDSKSSLPIIPPRLSSLSSDAGSSTALNNKEFFSSDAEQELSPKLSSPSLKRAPPSLYISTSASNHSPVCAEHRSTDPTQSPPLGKKTPWRGPLGAIDFQALKLRPMSTTFSSQFADIVAIPEAEHTSERELDTPTSTISSMAALSPFTSGSSRPSDDKSSPVEQSLVIKALQEQMIAAKKAWQSQIWELQGQVRDLQAEVEDLHAADEDKGYCEHCGRGGPGEEREASNVGTKKIGVVNRPRGRIGDTARFVSRN